MAPKGGSKQQSEEDLLLQDFSRNLSAKSSALFFGNAFIVSAIPICERREQAGWGGRRWAGWAGTWQGLADVGRAGTLGSRSPQLALGTGSTYPRGPQCSRRESRGRHPRKVACGAL